MIKVRAGQVWFSSFSEKEITMTKNDEDRFFNSDSPFYKFVPQNDLEWLAVKVESLGSNIKFIARRGSEYLIFEAEPEHTPGVYTRQQHQNMRYHLGQDKKPRYRLTGGEWVKV